MSEHSSSEKTDGRPKAGSPELDPRLSQVADASKGCFWSADAVGNLNSVCDCWSEVTGQPAEAAHREGWLETVHPEDREGLLNAWLSAEARASSLEVEARFLGKDGYRWRLVRASRVSGKGGDAAGWFGVLLDVEEIVQSRLVAETTAQTVLDTVVDAIVTIDGSGVVESFNHAAVRMFGYNAQEVIGQNVSMLMPAAYASKHDSYLERYRQTRQKRIIGIGREVIGRRKDGTTFPLDLSVAEVQLPDRCLFTGVMRDLTERQMARTALLRAERLAGIGQMVTAIGHESRNALQRIQASVELLKMQLGENADYCRDLQTIERADADLRTLFEDLRTWAIKPRLNLADHDLWESCAQAWDHAVLVRRASGANLEILADNVDTRVEADGHRLEQVFRNLFENALDAVKEPTRVAVRLADAVLENHPALRIVVSDNGPGLSEEESRRILKAFYTSKRNGVGLGLAIAKWIVEAHHGELAVLPPRPGSGAEFAITLPRQQPDLATRSDIPKSPADSDERDEA